MLTKIHPGIEICESLLSEPEDDQIDGDDFVLVSNQHASSHYHLDSGNLPDIMKAKAI